MMPDKYDRKEASTSQVGRRAFCGQMAGGLGAIALASLLEQDGCLAAPADPRLSKQPGSGVASGGILHRPHHRARAKRVIHIFSPGGVSQVDTLDYKPALAKLDGKRLTGKGTIDTFFGKVGVLRKSFYKFQQYGKNGSWFSSLLPELATCADELTYFHTLVAKSSSHTPACFQMNTGFTQVGFPSVGSWLSYGLGSLNDELPTFVVLPDPRGLPNGGSSNWSQGFLPAQHQGTAFATDGASDPIAHLKTPTSVSATERQASLQVLAQFNESFAQANAGNDALQARARSYELAAQMQTSIPRVLDLSDETVATQKLYGLDQKEIAASATNYLMARRLIEQGVRFVQIYNGGALGSPRINWDAHEDLVRNHNNQARQLDRPFAGLLKDLKQRGLLDDTLVVWTSEFGRTPFTQGDDGKGRDHHPLVFTGCMAGAGLRPGYHHGISDEVGYQPAEKPVTVYDFHATLLYLLGIDHRRLTYYHNGLDRRLTDVHGHVVKEVLA